MKRKPTPPLFPPQAAILKQGYTYPRTLDEKRWRETYFSVGRRWYHDEEVGRWLRTLYLTHIYTKQGQLRGLNISKRKDGWLTVIKTTYRGKHYVAFVDSKSYQDVFDDLVAHMKGRLFRWHLDKFAN